MQRIRQLHLWLGVFFSPLIIFFAFSGMLQTFRWNDSGKNGSYTAPTWIVKLAAIHKNQRLARGPGGPSPMPLKILVAIMSVGLVITSILGIYMAFKYERRHWAVWGMIIGGIVLPLVLLFI